MHVTVLPADLGRWDQARAGDLLLVPIWSDVRPLRGTAGLVDWRMCGRLSGWIVGDKLTGAPGEQMLFPSGNRLAWRLILAAGAGSRADFTEKRLRALVRRMVKALKGLGARRVALALPGRDGQGQHGQDQGHQGQGAGPAGVSGSGSATASAQPSPRRTLELILAEIEAHAAELTELTVVVPPAAHKELSDVVRLRASRS